MRKFSADRLNHVEIFTTWWFLQLLEAKTICATFKDNSHLCGEVSERVIQHFIHCIETHGRHVQYLKFLQTVVKAEGQFLRRSQDMVMQEVSHFAAVSVLSFVSCGFMMGSPQVSNANKSRGTNSRTWSTLMYDSLVAVQLTLTCEFDCSKYVK